jgi:hypothetical protein
VGGPKSYDSTETVVLYIIYYTPFSASVGPWKETFLFASQNDGNWRALRSIQRVRWARGVGTQRPFLRVNQPKKTGAHARPEPTSVYICKYIFCSDGNIFRNANLCNNSYDHQFCDLSDIFIANNLHSFIYIQYAVCTVHNEKGFFVKACHGASIQVCTSTSKLNKTLK